MDKENKKLKFLYQTVLGRILLKAIFCRRWFSKLASIYYKSSLSKVEGYKSYNDWFTRKKDIQIHSKESELIAVAESNLSIYNVDGSSFKIKNSEYDLEELIQDNKITQKFKCGKILIFRLEYNNYHRYIYTDDCNIISHKEIKGELHTVRPIESKFKVYKRNTREITLMSTKNFGEVLQIEVGALLVGKIVNENSLNGKRGDEKGHFELGGSTIIQVYQKDKIKLLSNIKQNGEEIKVQIGQKIGEVYVKKN